MNQNLKNNSTLILIICAVVVTASIVYSMFIRPIQKDRPLNGCLNAMEGVIQEAQKRTEQAYAEGKINEKEKTTALSKLSTQLAVLEDDCRKRY